jgi:hypothetical protein
LERGTAAKRQGVAHTPCRNQLWRKAYWAAKNLRRRRKRFSAWKFDFAVGENVFPPGSSISLSAKTFFRLEVRFRCRRKRFSAWKFDFAVGENVFRLEV